MRARRDCCFKSALQTCRPFKIPYHETIRSKSTVADINYIELNALELQKYNKEDPPIPHNNGHLRVL